MGLEDWFFRRVDRIRGVLYGIRLRGGGNCSILVEGWLTRDTGRITDLKVMVNYSTKTASISMHSIAQILTRQALRDIGNTTREI